MRHDDRPLPDPGAADRPDQHWMCGRHGGQAPCELGPSARGRCLRAEPCRPRRTWASQSRRAATTCLILIVGALGWIGASPDRAAVVLRPGELSTPHAQIVSQAEPASRCAVCHVEASLEPASWFRWGGKEHVGIDQTDRCLDCHHVTIDRDRARLPHGLSPEQRRDLRSAARGPQQQTWHDRLPSPAVSMDDVACSACHREHHGRDGDLLAVSDAQCQTCHADRFASFADGHPDWTDWPYGRGGEIAFDHATHAAEHYPATRKAGQPRSFDCDSCHRRQGQDKIIRSPSYDHACGECHDESLRLESAQGFALVALPTLPDEMTGSVKAWPEPARGFADGQLAALAELLMRGDSAAENAAAQLGGGHFHRLEPADPDQQKAARTLAAAHHQLMREAATEGQSALLGRFETAGIPSSLSRSLVRSLPPQLIEEAYRRWFGPNGGGDEDRLLAPEPVGGDADDAGARLLDDDLLEEDASDGDSPGESDPLRFEGDPLSLEGDAAPARDKETSLARFDAEAKLPAGGWYRDDLRSAIRYRAGGHADPVMTALLEMLSALPATDPARQRLLARPAAQACVRCHRSAVSPARSWRARRQSGRSGTFTKFSHRPHLNIQALADCSHCHALRAGADSDARQVSAHAIYLRRAGVDIPSSPSQGKGGVLIAEPVRADDIVISPAGDFWPLERASCAACHIKQAAGDRCTQCHRYHVDADQLTWPSP